jgi:hypothetical protein
MKEYLPIFIVCFVAALLAIALNDLVLKQIVQAQLDKEKSTPVGSLLTKLFGNSSSS